MWGILTWHEILGLERKLCWVPCWCQFNARIWQPDLRFESNTSTEGGSILLGYPIRCVFLTSHSLVTSGSQYCCLGFRSVEGWKGSLFFDNTVIDGQWNSWQESHWREAALLALQLAVFIIDGMAGNHCDSWPIIFMKRVTLSFQGKRLGTALNCTLLWLIAWEDKWWVGAWHQCCFETSI